MDVLMLESDPGAADAVVQELEEGGHRVFRCHEPGAAVFPCRALAGEGPCPLADPGIDVAVTVRAHADPHPSPREDGVACALRARVPLVVAGNDILNPYDEWAADVVPDGDVVGACERVLAAPSGDHSEVATDALREALQRRTGSTGNADALVWRDHRRLRVSLEGAEGLDDSVRGIVAADVAAALRAFDPVIPKIDIAFS
jgi:hypothetical protein